VPTLSTRPAREALRRVARFTPAMLARRTRGGGAPALPRAKTPTILQMEAVECGAAALAMVLSYHGRDVPLDQLRAACGVSRDGSKASNVLRAARTYGLVARGYKREPDALRAMPGPMIVHWNFNHFLVLEGFGDGVAYLNDPAAGPRVVSAQEFDQAFTGVVLTFEVGPDFKHARQKRGLLDAVAERLAGSRTAAFYCVLAGLALAIPGIVIPSFSRVFVDEILVKGMVDWMRPLALLMIATAIVAAGLTWLQQHHLLRLETKLALSTSSRFFWHTLRLPIGFFTQRYAGEIGSRVAINDRVAQLLSGDLATTVLNMIVIAFYAVLMAQYDLLLASVGVGIALLNFAALRYVNRRRADLNQRLMQDQGKLMGVAMSGLQTLETLKASGAESDFFARWSGQQAKVVNATQELGFQTQLLSTLPPLLLSVNTALLIGLGGFRVMSGHLTMGMLIALQALMIGFIAPVNRMVDLGATLQEVKGGMNRLDDVLRTPPDPSAGSLPVPEETAATGVVDVPNDADDVRPKLTGMLELRDVTFGYSPLDPPLLEGFDLLLRPGARVALVGGSGCGKSTLARLVCGLYDTWRGAVLFDGQPRAAVPREVLTNSFAVVDQDIFLFAGTIKDNLTLWDPTIAESDLVQAARDACIHDDITARPGGYAALVEEGGANFSGGQRQRLEIARALVTNPTLLVLDEATSALDPATEHVIDDNIRRRGCTCLIVAHRLSTIRDCDEIIVLDAGRIVQRGTHESLVQAGGAYAHLIAAE